MALQSKKNIVSLGHKSIKMTCEVYCGSDIRFITLTGQSVVLETINKPLVYLSDLNEEIEHLAELFFGYDVSKDIYNSLKLTTTNLHQSTLGVSESIFDISKKYSRIREQIFASNWKQKYINLCDYMNLSYKSVSEADWAFIQIVSRFIQSEVKYKKQILEFFFQKDRSYRTKKIDQIIFKEQLLKFYPIRFKNVLVRHILIVILVEVVLAKIQYLKCVIL
nr:hypothetical protein [Gracilaria tikvahiae]